MSNPFIYYFFVKVGFGNEFLEKTVEKANHNDKKETFFWVGYNETPIPRLVGEVFKQYPSRKHTDLYYLTLVSSVPRYREQTRLITYTDRCMQLWKINDSVRNLTRDEFLEHKKYCNVNNTNYEEEGNKALPVTLEKEIDRDKLPACVDSLRVHSYLNRGTFRYLVSTNRDLISDDSIKSDRLKNSFLNREDLSLNLVNQEQATKYKETYFACFVRKYLDWIRENSFRGSFGEKYQLNEYDIFELVFLIMSPAQLETAAMMFALSLGLQPDVGMGKALNVIDVRASLKHKNDWKQNASEIVVILERIMGHSGLSQQIRDNLINNGNLLFQCKDYSVNYNLPEHVLLFSPRTDKQDGKTIAMDQIKQYMHDNKEVFPLFRDWLQLLTFYYKTSKEMLKIK